MRDTAWRQTDLQQFATAYLESQRDNLAKMATVEYQQQGRGLVAITIRGPRLTDEHIQARPIQTGYRPRADYVRLTTPLLNTTARERVDHTIASIDHYDPKTQMVIAFVAGPRFLTLAAVVSLSQTFRDRQQ